VDVWLLVVLSGDAHLIIDFDILAMLRRAHACLTKAAGMGVTESLTRTRSFVGMNGAVFPCPVEG